MPATSATHQAIVRSLYRGFRDREPDPAGLAYWSARLAEGAGAQELVAALMESVRPSDPLSEAAEAALIKRGWRE